MINYEVSAYIDGRSIREDYSTAAEAKARAEELKSATVVKFYGRPNLPHCLPDIVWNSCTMWSISPDAGWGEHYIFDGYGRRINTNSPTDN